MADQAPLFSGKDLLGGADFDLGSHKGSFVFVAFMGLPWCGPCKYELPHLQSLANDYAGNPSVPSVRFVIVNNPANSQAGTVVAYAQQQNVTIPILDDAGGTVFNLYPDIKSVPTCVVVKPSGALCDERLVGASPVTALQALLIACGAPAPGAIIRATPFIKLSDQPPGTVLLVPVGGEAKIGDLPIPVESGPVPGKSPVGWQLGAMSREILRALAIHDAAAQLPDHESRISMRSTALRAAGASLARMTTLVELEAEVRPLASSELPQRLTKGQQKRLEK